MKTLIRQQDELFGLAAERICSLVREKPDAAVTLAAGLGQLADEETTRRNCQAVREDRAYTTRRLTEMGFSVIPSAANFVFATSPKIGGKELYLKLKERGILVRHFDTPRLKEYNRITIGNREQMEALLDAVKSILEE